MGYSDSIVAKTGQKQKKRPPFQTASIIFNRPAFYCPAIMSAVTDWPVTLTVIGVNA